MKVVLDANVLVSGLISSTGAPGQILDRWLAGQFKLFVSSPMLDELKRVLRYPRIAERITKLPATRFLEILEKNVEMIKGTLILNVLTIDPSDNCYLACAVEAHADYLVTGNRDHFLEAGSIDCDVCIISPRDFLDVLEKQ